MFWPANQVTRCAAAPVETAGTGRRPDPANLPGRPCTPHSPRRSRGSNSSSPNRPEKRRLAAEKSLCRHENTEPRGELWKSYFHLSPSTSWSHFLITTTHRGKPTVYKPRPSKNESRKKQCRMLHLHNIESLLVLHDGCLDASHAHG